MSLNFKSAKEMYDLLQSGVDIYCPADCCYAFLYNDFGSVAICGVTMDEAVRFEKKARLSGDYWTGVCGLSCVVIDSPEWYEEMGRPRPAVDEVYEFCKESYANEWVRCSDVIDENKKPLNFKSAKEMYDFLQDGNDLYCPSTQLFVFLYSGYGSIAYYYIDKDDAVDLEREVRESRSGGWESCLGPGGHIIDTPEWYENNGHERPKTDEVLEFCEEHFLDPWILCQDVLSY